MRACKWPKLDFHENQFTCQQFRPLNCPLFNLQTIESYSAELKHLIGKSKHQVVILIDSVDKIFDIKDINWLPLELENNVKIVLTISDSESSLVLKALQSKISPQNFLLLSSFTPEQWEDVLTYGGGATNGSLQLPESWKKSDERAPIQAKVWQKKKQELRNLHAEIFLRFYGGWRGWDSANWRT